MDVDSVMDAARAEHPEIVVDPEALRRHVARHAPSQEERAALRAGDLLLAFACSAGDPHAVAVFRARYGDDIRRALSKVRVAASDVDDLSQELSRRMFVPPDAKLADYSGRGDLRGWVRIVATRFALDLGRLKKNDAERPTADETLARAPAAGDGPELAYFRTRYRAEVTLAIEEAARSLDVEDRNALREHYVRGLGVDQIAAAHGIHRATAARRVQRAREALASAVRSVLDRKHGLHGPELVSALGLVRSQLHVTLERILA